MTRFLRFVLCVTVLFLAAASGASADPVRITSGFLAAPGPAEVAPLSVTGTRGFSTRGITDPIEVNLEAFSDCTPCMPGDQIRLGGFLGAFDATTTLDGKSYDLTFSINSPSFMNWSITAAAVQAPAFSLTHQLLETPFTLTGLFFPSSQSSGIPLVGMGTASILLAPIPQGSGPGLWQLSLLHYDFQGAMAPTPEPASLTVFGVALAAAGVWRSRRRPV
jgi:hypothetical protein